MATPKSAAELTPVIQQLVDQHRAERTRLDVIARYCANKVIDIHTPKRVTPEYRKLVRMARFNILNLVVTAVAQNLFVDGYRPTGESGRAPNDKNLAVWDKVWQANRMDARQAMLYRHALRFGYSYATVLPGEIPGRDSDGRVPVITPYSPRKLTALYDDPVNDEWAEYAMVVKRRPNSGLGTAGTKLTVYDDNFRYQVTHEASGWVLSVDAEEHGFGVCPVVRFLDTFGEDEDETDDDWDHARPEGIPPGKVEPILPAQQQLNQTTFSLLMTQQFQAFKQRWATGMAIEEDANGQEIAPRRSGPDMLWQNDSPDGRFGEFAESDLKGYLDSRDKIILYVSAVAQIPPQNLLVGSGISNISAEALVALESGHRHDINQHKTGFGESIEQMLRLAGLAMDDRATWEDQSAQVVWRDTTPRSLAQVADALGKMATLLGVPEEALWERIPDVTDSDLVNWKSMKDEEGLMDELRGLADGQRQEEPGAISNGERPDNPSPPPPSPRVPAGTAPNAGAGAVR
jgi:hypothetical protein